MKNSESTYSILQINAGFVPIAVLNNKLYDMYFPVKIREDAVKYLSSTFGSVDICDNCDFADLRELLTQYFEGTPTDFSGVDVEFNRYTGFTKRVLQELVSVPYGSILTYAEMAARCDNPKAARAVGNALGRNRVPIVLPCHRVVAANSKIGGFTGGIEWKQRLLEIEGIKL